MNSLRWMKVLRIFSKSKFNCKIKLNIVSLTAWLAMFSKVSDEQLKERENPTEMIDLANTWSK